MTYEIDYKSAEQNGFSSKLMFADRWTVYVKLFSASPTRYFSGDQYGVIHKEISKAELDVWLKILADSDEEVLEINKKIETGKRY